MDWDRERVPEMVGEMEGEKEVVGVEVAGSCVGVIAVRV